MIGADATVRLPGRFARKLRPASAARTASCSCGTPARAGRSWLGAYGLPCRLIAQASKFGVFALARMLAAWDLSAVAISSARLDVLPTARSVDSLCSVRPEESLTKT